MLCSMCQHGISDFRKCTLCGVHNCRHIKCKHTITEVREHLPDITLMVSPGNYSTAQIAGRKQPYASVYPIDDNRAVIEVSWATVTRSVNSGQPIHV